VTLLLVLPVCNSEQVRVRSYMGLEVQRNGTKSGNLPLYPISMLQSRGNVSPAQRIENFPPLSVREREKGREKERATPNLHTAHGRSSCTHSLLCPSSDPPPPTLNYLPTPTPTATSPNSTRTKQTQIIKTPLVIIKIYITLHYIG